MRGFLRRGVGRHRLGAGDGAAGELSSLLQCLERHALENRRTREIEVLEEIVAVAPDRVRERLLLGRHLEQRGRCGAAGQAFDECLEVLRPSDLDRQVIGLLLNTAWMGPDPAASMARLTRLDDALAKASGINRPRMVAVARLRTALSMRDRTAFLTRWDRVARRWPQRVVGLEFERLAQRWRRSTRPNEDAVKVFVVGLSRTGTTSVHRALRALGLASLHWVNPLTGNLPDEVDLHLYDAFGDINITVEAESLVQRFPNARFIWTTRPCDTWATSVRRHYENLADVTAPRQLLEPAHAGRFGGRLRLIHGPLYALHDSWEAGHAAHEERLAAVFDGASPSRFTRLAVTEGEGWAPLCRLLGTDPPARSFPHANVGPRGGRA